MLRSKSTGCSYLNRSIFFFLCSLLLIGCIPNVEEISLAKIFTVWPAIRDELGPTETIVARRIIDFDGMAGSLLQLKIVDNITGQIRDVLVDISSGDHRDFDSVRQEAVVAWRELYGAASPELIDVLRDGAIDVYHIDVEVTDYEHISVLRRELMSQGIEIVSVYGPILTVRSTQDQILTLSRLPYVSSIVPHYSRENLALNAAADLGQEPVAVSHRLGIGVGWLTAIWEVEACIFRSHEDFEHIQWQPRLGDETCNVNNQAGHSTKVAGVLGAFRGTAQTVGLYRGGFFDVDSYNESATSDMWARHPIFVNASFEISRADAWGIDKAAYETGVMVFNGAGNEAEDEAHCFAFNALCVGGYNHQRTINLYEDDTLVAGSSYRNDARNGREFPDLLGPYHVLTATNRQFALAPDSGTSFSTPAVTGLGALLLTSYPFVFFQRPALMRAVLMASAQAHPIIVDGRRIPDLSDAIDDRTGAGVPNGFRAQAIMDERSFAFRRITPSTLGVQASFEVDVQERVRVVLTWDQCPGYMAYAPGGVQLTADLDLAVQAPSALLSPFEQTITYTNVSFVDNKEIVEFVSQAAGTVDVVVSGDRFGTCEADGNVAVAPMALAWTKEPAPIVITSPTESP